MAGASSPAGKNKLEKEDVLIDEDLGHGCTVTTITAPNKRRKLRCYIQTTQPQDEVIQHLKVVPDEWILYVTFRGSGDVDQFRVVALPFAICVPMKAGESEPKLDTADPQCPNTSVGTDGCICITCCAAEDT